MGTINQILRKIVCIPIQLYQYLISPMMKPSCRYYPSCSVYANSAIKHHGIINGLWMALKRVARCHPWSPGGYDPIFPNDEKF
ncbi:MAG: membrane protein insertion efficiency factor YidD [Legionella sp.]|nr:membrane protein insertion efficiency factor YidD [Legionella sp.]